MFTLIELLIVIAIIAILASLASVIQGERSRANTIDFSNTRQLMHAAQMYCGDNDDYLPYQ